MQQRPLWTLGGQKSFRYAQELLNQVVPRKRANVPANYTLINEEGLYNDSVVTAVRIFRTAFMDANGTNGVNVAGERIGNTRVNFTVEPNGTVTYQNTVTSQPTEPPNNDNTTDIFRKLMKDYGLRGTPSASRDWLHRVIDGRTLIGGKKRIDSILAGLLPDSDPDNLVNGTAGNTKNDTGLYELYANVVEKFVDSQMRLADSYARKASPDNVLNGQRGQWVPREGPAQIKTNIATYLPVAYSYGGRQTVQLFNDTVSRHGAPRTADFANNATYRSYRGHIGDVDSNLVNQFPHGNVGAGNRKWPGLLKDEEYFDWYRNTNRSNNHHFYHEYWAGIDCIGLTLHGLRYADDPRRDHDNDGRSYADEQILTGAGDSAIPGVRVGNTCISGDCQNPQSLVSVHTYRGMMDTNVQRFFDAGNADLLYYWQRTDAQTKLVRKGDVVRYGDTHISTVYSERPEGCGDTGATCTYEIVHAYGVDSYTDKKNNAHFMRKVIKMPNQIIYGANKKLMPEPTGFGRIKLWD